MGKVEIKIPHVVWRDGRPRFVPGPKLRALGYKGEDLKDEAGAWLGLDEAIAWSRRRDNEILLRREAIKTGADLPRPTRRQTAFTVGTLLQQWQHSPKWKDLAAKTQLWYRQMIDTLATYDPDLWAEPAAAITGPIAYGLYEQLYQDRSLSMARAIVATCRSAWSWAKRKGLVKENPFRELGMKTPPPRVRVGSIAEMRALVATADALGRPEIGDAIMLGLCTGQRQGDRLALVEERRTGGRIHFRQGKTDARVSVPELHELTTRLDAARERRQGWRVKFPNVILDEQARRPWAADGNHYRHVFATVRAAAAKGIRSDAGELIQRPFPSLEHFHDQDLRDTAVTWLANARCTVPEICAITGHSAESAHKILKHYLATTSEQADTAIDKLRTWLDAQGGLATRI